MKLKKIIGLAVLVVGTYKIGETVGRLKGGLNSFKYILKQHPELDCVTCTFSDSKGYSTFTINKGVFEEENGDESQTEEQET